MCCAYNVFLKTPKVFKVIQLNLKELFKTPPGFQQWSSVPHEAQTAQSSCRSFWPGFILEAPPTRQTTVNWCQSQHQDTHNQKCACYLPVAKSSSTTMTQSHCEVAYTCFGSLSKENGVKNTNTAQQCIENGRSHNQPLLITRPSDLVWVAWKTHWGGREATHSHC